MTPGSNHNRALPFSLSRHWESPYWRAAAPGIPRVFHMPRLLLYHDVGESWGQDDFPPHCQGPAVPSTVDLWVDTITCGLVHDLSPAHSLQGQRRVLDYDAPLCVCVGGGCSKLHTEVGLINMFRSEVRRPLWWLICAGKVYRKRLGQPPSTPFPSGRARPSVSHLLENWWTRCSWAAPLGLLGDL